MTTNRYAVSLVVMALLLCFGAPGASRAALPQLSPAWEREGFKNPESVEYDSARNVYYVSNVNGVPTDHDGNGFISKLSAAGEIVALQWVTGLDAPKGMVVVGGKLYVSDINRLVEIDIATGKIAKTYPAPEAKFLNDVTAAADGKVYVSDMNDDAIYWLDGADFGVWLRDPALLAPNGLRVEKGRLVVACFGKNNDGRLKQVSLAGKKISALSNGAVGSLDGLEPDGHGNYFVTDWPAGKVFLIDAAGVATTLKVLNQGTADLEYVPAKKLLLVPMMVDGKVAAFNVE